MAGLNATEARIFRITHIRNLPWILEHGLHSQTSEITDPNFIGIGKQDLIEHRQIRSVPIGPGGALRDYVPFYFTPYSIMMYNIKTGYNGVIRRANDEIVILVSSLPKLAGLGVSFVFTNGHAYMQETEFFDALSDLNRVDWDLLRSRDFSRDPEDPGKLGRYQAEALAYRHVPVEAILGIACYNSDCERSIEEEVTCRGLSLHVKALPEWYF